MTVGLLILFVVLLLSISGITYYCSRHPSHAHTWEFGQEVMPRITIQDGVATIENARDFEWHAPMSGNERYLTSTFPLEHITTVDVLVSHFSTIDTIAHVFFSFGFIDGTHLCISLEARRRLGQTYSPWWGLFRRFHTIWVVATERDMLGVRIRFRNERVYLYETHASPEVARELFVRMSESINAVYTQPRFYNTALHNCIGELARHLEQADAVRVRKMHALILPGTFTQELHRLGFIRGEGSFEETRIQARKNADSINTEGLNRVHTRDI
jgi:hypothetical protein